MGDSYEDMLDNFIRGIKVWDIRVKLVVFLGLCFMSFWAGVAAAIFLLYADCHKPTSGPDCNKDFDSDGFAI